LRECTFELFENEARVAVHVFAVGEKGDAAVGDVKGFEIGTGEDWWLHLELLLLLVIVRQDREVAVVHIAQSRDHVE